MDWFLYDNDLRHERVKIEMLLRFQNKMNVEIIGFSVTHFGFALDLSDIDL